MAPARGGAQGSKDAGQAAGGTCRASQSAAADSPVAQHSTPPDAPLPGTQTRGSHAHSPRLRAELERRLRRRLLDLGSDLLAHRGERRREPADAVAAGEAAHALLQQPVVVAHLWGGVRF